ncbi:carbazole dioxygenase [Sphingobium yanoikuyae]|jgi:carbazole 1,9a-dioxygenase terminal dioxygenase component|uniref:Carbazole dioxygenase n=1 Tax=Sphingobium yanoikuyae TaxID=13690 RepID=A0A177IWQ0_SPHYA|nr:MULTISPECIES: Rieske 2Fe-2S domain-containing protein [Sphingobium]OAH33267.1 carbazole dioxygenase [Sphingobium yanoikuyae]QJR05054.1 Rieske 2Fe-2S domain-containing protein [Sphingobium yanoikuyae]
MNEEPLVNPEVLSMIGDWKGYVEAKLGFRNHWYPIRFSKELAEGQLEVVELMGEKLLIKRIDGQVYAMRDRCLHRGVPLSRKPDCYTKDTITCWYHGYTYRFQTGELANILAVPDSRLIKRRKIVTYPATEAQGLIFIFLGDEDQVHDLKKDVPPGFLDEDRLVLGKHRVVNSNWRLGAENGFDGLHIFIHKDTTLRHYRTFNFPIGHTPLPGAVQVIEEEDGPKGVMDDFALHKPVWDGVIDGEVVVSGPRSTQIKGTSAAAGTSIWMPGVLKVDNFPIGGLTQYEWYVPLDEGRHLYVQTIGKPCKDEQERLSFANDFEAIWKPHGLDGFNADDIWAREVTEPFYQDDYGWVDEMLCEPDETILEWRRLASRQGRGIQQKSDLR